MKRVYLNELLVYQKSYQKSFWWTFSLSIIILVLCFTLSFSMADFFVKLTKLIAESIANNVAEASGKAISELSDVQTAFVILGNNLKTLAIIIVVGLVPFYRLPSFLAILQFSMIGMVFGGLYAMGYNVVNAFLFSFLPHALIELTALIYSVAIGNFINRNILLKVFFRKKNVSEPIGRLLKQALKSYLVVVLPLLVVAALIEGFITPRLSALFL